MAIAMVLLILLLGAGLLQATRQQLAGRLALVADERQFLLEQHQALSALAWGRRLVWPLQQGWHCQRQPQFGWRACLLRQGSGETLLRGAGTASGDAALALWQWLTPGEAERWQTRTHGWLDYCPLPTPARCFPDEK